LPFSVTAPNSTMAARKVLRRSSAVVAALVPPTYVYYAHESGDYYLEGARRGIYFWGRAGPIIAHYFWTDYATREGDVEDRNKAFETLHEKYAPVALDIILALRGFYVKVGQFGSARGDVLPAPYIRTFRQLQDQMPHTEGIDYIKETITTSLGRPADEIFSHIDPKPLGAASIGQVHKAKLCDGGQDVVVKVQYPSVRRTFYSDMSCIRTVASLAEPSLAPVLDELRKQFLTEFDYRGEAQNLEDVAERLFPAWEDKVAMPAPLKGLCGELVMTMTFLPGEKLETALRREWERLGFNEADLSRSMSTRVPPSSRQFSILMWLFSAKLLFVDVKSAMNRILVRFASAMGVKGVVHEEQQHIRNRQQIVRTLLAVHAQQVLVDGVFNADLHPGNFLYLPDGRIGLIDFGQVKRIDEAQRKRLATLLIALAHRDRAATVSAMQDLGVKSRKMSPDFLEANGKLLFTRVDAELTKGRPMRDYFEELRKLDTLTVMPGELYLPSRAAAMLRGIAMLLHCHVSIADEWCTVAEGVLTSTSEGKRRALDLAR